MPIAVLYRAVDQNELELIRKSGFKEFPPRLPEQPFFYPVLTEEYAIVMARDWNAQDGNSGYVTRFEVDSEILSGYPVRTVGESIHREYWIPAEELTDLNGHIIGLIEVIHEFHS